MLPLAKAIRLELRYVLPPFKGRRNINGSVARYGGGSAGKSSVFDISSLSEDSLLKLCQPIDDQFLSTLQSRGYEVRIGKPGSETFAYLEVREARAITFAGDEKLILLRHDAIKSEC